MFGNKRFAGWLAQASGFQWVTLAGDDRAQDGLPGDTQNIAEDMVKLQVHLLQGQWRPRLNQLRPMTQIGVYRRTSE